MIKQPSKSLVEHKPPDDDPGRMEFRFSLKRLIYYIVAMNNAVMNNIPPVLRPASPDSDVLTVIAGRWSSRAIDSSLPVDPDIMPRLFEAARWAPSAANNQPWRFLAFGPENPTALEKARGSLTSGNAWAQAAPRLLFILTRTDRPGSGKPNLRAMYEAGMAAVQMALQATEEGLVFHQMAGFDEKKVRHEFDVPEIFAIITAAAVGWPGPAVTVSENLRNLETDIRNRKSQNELVFADGAVPAE